VGLLKSALSIILEWKEFSEVYDVLGVGVGGIIFGVENLMGKKNLLSNFPYASTKQKPSEK